jgi:homoserine kinase
MKSVRIEVPASAANLGPGFDCLALALDLTNQFEFTLLQSGLEVTYSGAASGLLPTDESNLAVVGFYTLANQLGISLPGLKLAGKFSVPSGSGLGSSSTAVVAGLMAASSLLEANLSRQELLQLAAEIEGHADNAAAALFGGLVAVVKHADGWNVLEQPLAPMRLVIVVPELEFSTEQMRAVMPSQIELQQSVANGAAILAMQQALANADFAQMMRASAISFHQETRIPLIPGAEGAVAAGRSAGAAVLLAGAGPSLLALSADNHAGIGAAMQAAFNEAGVEAAILNAASSPHGALVTLPG